MPSDSLPLTVDSPQAQTPDQNPLILVMVGTDYHPFDRLVDWTDEWLATRPGAQVRMVTQFGRTHQPVRAQGREFIPRAELDALLAEASVVVCHGGPSTIVETWRRGLVPIVVARSAQLGEHVDDHQQRFARAMADRGLIRLVADRALLLASIDEAVAHPFVVADGEVLHDPAESALRLGALVDDLVALGAGRRRWGRRRRARAA